MTFDALALHAIRDELATTVVGGRVERLALASPYRLGLTIYAHRQRRHLLISVDPADARLHLSATPLQRDPGSVPPFLLLLRKYVREGWIEAVEQPLLERVLSMTVSKRLDDGAPHQVRLIIEVMGRRSNAILVDADGAILDALRRAGPSKNPDRPLLPHLRYSPPPPQDRLDPLAESTVARLRDEAFQASTPPPLASLLSQRLAGCSPQLAREIAWRTSGSIEATASPSTDWSRLRSVLDDLLAPLSGGAWQPCVAWREDQPIAVAPYRLTHFQQATLQPFETISQAIEAYHQVERLSQGRPAGAASLRQMVAPLAAALDHRREQLERKRASLQRALDEAGRLDDLREAGEAILASATSLAPGQVELAWNERLIPLDPTLSPVENAQRYFKEYRKTREASRQVPELLEQATLQLAYLDQAAALLETADDVAQVRAIRAELQESGLVKVRTHRRDAADKQRRRADGRKRTGSPPLQLQTAEGFDILVGTSARGNEEVTFERAQPDDVWLHARGVPGAHVVIRGHGRPVPPAVVEQAARLAAGRSAHSQSARVAVDWTRRRYVRRQRGGPPGLVTYTNEQTLLVAPAQPAMLDVVAESDVLIDRAAGGK